MTARRPHVQGHIDEERAEEAEEEAVSASREQRLLAARGLDPENPSWHPTILSQD
jgi:hypothetical protein